MKSKYFAPLVLAVLVSMLAACNPAPSATATPVPAPVQKVEQKPAWETTWAALVAEGKKEGRVTVYSTIPADISRDMGKRFNDQFGIELEFVTGRGAEVIQKLQTERRAGLYLGDAATLSVQQFVANDLRSMMDPVVPLLMRPDVTDTSKWLGGKLPVLDREGDILAFIGQRASFQIYNTDMAKDGELPTIRAFADPKWRGKIVMMDPTVLSSATNWYQFALRRQLGGVEQGRAYMKELAKNVAATTMDYRLLNEWVARGKYAIAVPVRADEAIVFMREGAPIKFVESASDPQRIGASWGTIEALKNRPHPKATQVFINWLMTKENLAAVSKASGLPMTRVDVPTEGLTPYIIPRAGDLGEDEDSYQELNAMLEWAKEDFAIIKR